MEAMSTLMPVVVVFLALIAAGSIAFIAWELTSKKFLKSIDRNESDDSPEA